MSRYKAYPEYKDSGVEWLGLVPRHWNARQLKFLCTCNDEVLGESIHPEYEIEYIDIGSVSASEGISKTETMMFSGAPSRARRIVRDGDVIVSTVRTYLEAIASIDNPPPNLIVSTGFAVIRPNQYLHKKFAAYCLRTSGFIKEVIARSVGVSYPAINASDLINIKAPLPQFSEQQKIANFLDHETAKIDTLIAKQQELIKLLKEKRQAVISHAVTKGLNPNAPMRDSGVEWLGEVPAHWVIGKIKHITAEIKDAMVDGPFGSSVNTDTDYVDAGVPVIRTVNITNEGFSTENLKYMREEKYEELKRHSVYPNDVLFSKVGTIGNSCVLPSTVEKAILSTTGSCKISLNLKKFVPEYLVYCFRLMHEDLMLIANSNVQPFLNMSNIKNLRVPLPPLDEQVQVLRALELRVEKFEQGLSKALASERLLQERRTALISAAVTGKIDVRDWQSPVDAAIAA